MESLPLMQNGKEHMQVYARPPTLLPNGHSLATTHVASPPNSPANSPRLRNGRSIGRTRSGKIKYSSPAGGVPSSRQPRTFMQRLTILLLTFFVRRHRVLLLAPFIYVTGMVLYMGGAPPFPGRYRPGSVYRSDQVFEKLWPEMQSANASLYGVSFLSIC